MSTVRISHLDSLRGLAILMVVGIHASGYAALDRTKDLDRLLVFLVFTIAVQTFFFTDGYLFASKQERSFDYRAHVLRSARRLLVPWLIFLSAYSVARLLFECAGHPDEQLLLNKPFKEIILCLYSSCPAEQLYFLVALFFIRTLGFALRPVSRLPGWGVLACVGVYALLFRTVIIHIPHAPQDPFFAASAGMQYYLLGMSFYKFREQLARFSLQVILFSVLLVMLSVVWDKTGSWVPDRSSFVVKICYLSGLYCFCLRCLQGENLLTRMGRCSMEIYLLHHPVLMKLVTVVVFAFISDRFINFGLITATCFFASYAIGGLIHRLPYGGVLFGEKWVVTE